MMKALAQQAFGCLLLIFWMLAGSQCKIDPNKIVSPVNSIEDTSFVDQSFHLIDSVKNLVRSNDLILRTGKDFTSTLLRNLSQSDKTYSHCGIAKWENGKLFVYHIIGGEANPDGRIRKDSFAFFCNPYENSGFGVYRYSLSQSQVKQAFRRLQNFIDQDVRFDFSFDLHTDSLMYCSELVYKMLDTAANNFIPLTVANNKKFVALDNLYLHNNAIKISRIVFPRR